MRFTRPGLLCLALAACGVEADLAGPHILHDPCEPTVIVTAADATAGELASIDAALAMWADVGIDTLTRMPSPAAQRILLGFEDAAPLFFGLYEPTRGQVVVNRQLQDGQARAVTIAHELGHALGLFHIDRDRRRSVMNEGNLSVIPTQADADELMRYWGPCSRGI